MPDLLSMPQPPHDNIAEQAVIGSMLFDARCIPEVVRVLKAEDFYSDVNRTLFETIYSMFIYSRKIDTVTLTDQLKIDGVYSDETRDYIFNVVQVTPMSLNVMQYANIVRDQALLRRLAQAGTEINAVAMEGQGEADKILELAEQKIYDIRQGRENGGLKKVSEVMTSVYSDLAEASRSGQRIPGLPTGLADLDSAIMGLNKSDLILVAARPGMGKTSIALNIALNVAHATPVTIAIFSLEMSRAQLCRNLLAMESHVELKKLQTGQLSSDDWGRVVASCVSISDMNILIDENPMLTVADISAACRRLDDLGLVIIDYLQLMTSAGGRSRANENRQTVVSEISRMLKIMAKDLNVPVICASQLSRANEGRQDKRPMLSDLRESGAIEQDADIVLALYRDDYYNKETDRPNVAECIILKNRRGETGTVELRWTPEYTTFSSLDTRHEE